MFKATVKLVALIAVVLVAYPVMHYRAVSPCEMLRKELMWQMEERIEDAAATAKAEIESLGIESNGDGGELQSTLEGVAAGVAAGVAQARVRQMSSSECTAELWRITIGGDDPYAGDS